MKARDGKVSRFGLRVGSQRAEKGKVSGFGLKTGTAAA